MIAEIYPILRLPRRFSFFDYIIPDGTKLKRGALVKIPWRSGQKFGIVARVKDETQTKKLKSITNVMDANFLSADELAFFEFTAGHSLQSVSAVLYSFVPTPPKRSPTSYQLQATSCVPHSVLSIPNHEVDTIKTMAAALENKENAFLQCPDLRRAAVMLTLYLKKRPQSNCIIAVPNVRDAQALAAHLSSFHPLLLTGQEKNNARYELFRAWHERGKILIGTRLSLFFANANTDAIFLLKANHPNFQQADRNPRFDSKTLAHRHGRHSRIFFCDSGFKVDDLLMSPLPIILYPNLPAPVLVDMEREKNVSPHPNLSFTTANSIEEKIKAGKQVLCFYNRKGRSQILLCQDCGQKFLCAICQRPLVTYEKDMVCPQCQRHETIPLACPGCQGTNLKERGAGNRALAEAMKKTFPKVPVHLLEKGISFEKVDGPAIYLVTQHYLENIHDPFAPMQFGLVAELDADQALHQPTFRSLEQAWLRLEELRALAFTCGAEFLVQTRQYELFNNYFADPLVALQNELVMRQSYELPPVRQWLRLYPAARGKAKIKDLNELKEKILGLAPTTLAMISEVNKKTVLDLGIKHTDQAVILPLLQQLNDDLIIDATAFL